jgi:hypothetical protein
MWALARSVGEGSYLVSSPGFFRYFRCPMTTTRDLRRTVRRLGVVLALCVVPGMAVAAVTVKGRIVGGQKLLNPVWNEAKDPKSNRYTFREPSATVRPDTRILTGFLPKELCVAALGEKGTPMKQALRMVVAGGRISPVTLVVAEGQQIQFENHDPFPHRLHEPTGKGGLQAGEMLPAKNRNWTPTGPGKWEVRDQTSPSVRAWVVVEPRVVAVGYPDRKGEFAIELEPGVYKLRGYFNGEPVGKEMDVTVKPAPAEQTLGPALTVAEGSADAGAPAAADAGGGG